jgi:hypothetical protein
MRYVPQGGDRGNAFTEFAANKRLQDCSASTSTCLLGSNPTFSKGAPPPAGLSAEEQHAYGQFRDFFANHDVLDVLDVLDNVTMYCLTNTGISSRYLCWENKGAFFDARGITIPVAVSAFPDELYQCPQTWAKHAYSKLIYYNKLGQGREFRGLGTAASFFERASRRFQIAALKTTTRESTCGDRVRRSGSNEISGYAGSQAGRGRRPLALASPSTSPRTLRLTF